MNLDHIDQNEQFTFNTEFFVIGEKYRYTGPDNWAIYTNHTIAQAYCAAICRRNRRKFFNNIEHTDDQWFIIDGISTQAGPVHEGGFYLRQIMFATDRDATIIIPVRESTAPQHAKDHTHFANVMNNYGNLDWSSFGPADRTMVQLLIVQALGSTPRIPTKTFEDVNV